MKTRLIYAAIAAAMLFVTCSDDTPHPKDNTPDIPYERHPMDEPLPLTLTVEGISLNDLNDGDVFATCTETKDTIFTSVVDKDTLHVELPPPNRKVESKTTWITDKQFILQRDYYVSLHIGDAECTIHAFLQKWGETDFIGCFDWLLCKIEVGNDHKDVSSDDVYPYSAKLKYSNGKLALSLE